MLRLLGSMSDATASSLQEGVVRLMVWLGLYELPPPPRPARPPRPGWRTARSTTSEGGRELA
jgi:hypothetical protein